MADNQSSNCTGVQVAARGRRQFLAATAATVAMAALSFAPAARSASRPRVEVWKDPGCECCNDWIAHLKANGFEVVAHNRGNTDMRARLGMPLRYGSCHTGQIGGYAIEGHVPARDIHRLLKQKPEAVGLAVPAMPIGSPGMDGPAYGARRDPYDVFLVKRDGSARIFQSYR